MRFLVLNCFTLIAASATVSDAGMKVPLYDVTEETIAWDSSSYDNPWEQVRVSAVLTAPSGETARIGGFYYAPNTWKMRFSPWELGEWTWKGEISDGENRKSLSGSFRAVPSDIHGFVRPNPHNKFRWMFSDGSPYYPIGIGDCLWNHGDTSTQPTSMGMDGDFRGPKVGEEGWNVDLQTYFSTYAAAGFNLFRWSVDNCAYGLAERIDPKGNLYLAQQGVWGDELVQMLRKNGFRIYMAFFGFKPPFPTDSDNHEKMDAVKRYVKYVVDRYGAYVDFWELMNEFPNNPDTIDDDWYRQVAVYLRSIDPYKHPISTSWERPDLDCIEISSPHWYERESEFDSDLVTKTKFEDWKKAGKPVMVGEQGNRHANWDARSAVRLRIRTWTSFFVEGTLIFWNTSFAKDYRNQWAANVYVGPEERGYIKTFAEFTQGFDPKAETAEVTVSPKSKVRGYALSGPDAYAVYLHNYVDHSTPTTGVEVEVDPQFSGTATWLDPVTGRVVAAEEVKAGKQLLKVPAFTVDIALKIQRVSGA